MFRTALLSALALSLLHAVDVRAQAPQAAPAPAPDLSMTDQFGAVHRLADLRGDVVVLVYADRAGAEASRDLGTRMHVHFHPTAAGMPPAQAMQAPVTPLPNWPAGVRLPDAKMVAAASIGEVPGLLQGYVRSRFRSAVPVGPIWLDMTDALRKHFGVEPGVPNIVIIDTKGQVRVKLHGNLDVNQFTAIAGYIDALRNEARPAAKP